MESRYEDIGFFYGRIITFKKHRALFIFMKQKNRRRTHCNNCESELLEDYNFCPTCGQSNTDNNVTFSTLIREFLDNYLGVDSKLAHSVLPFVFSPGALTNRFNDGKIKHFIHPVRLYFVMSLFYFFTISYLLSDYDLRSFDDEINYTSATIDAFKEDNLLSLIPDSTKIELLSDTLLRDYQNITSFDVLYDSLAIRYGEDFLEDTQLDLRGIEMPKSQGESTIDRYHRLARDRSISDKAFMDSLSNGGQMSFDSRWFDEEDGQHISEQVRKIFANDEGFKNFVLGNLPLMMFILIPLFALILKFVYIRRKHLYIKHVVNALHIHSFAYLMYGIGLLIMFKVVTAANFQNANISMVRGVIGGIFFVLVSTYAYISFLKVYQQGWFKTLIKFNIVGFIYAFFLQVFFYAEILISFWYYN
jgi:ribosomal protein L32